MIICDCLFIVEQRQHTWPTITIYKPGFALKKQTYKEKKYIIIEEIILTPAQKEIALHHVMVW